MVFSPYFSIQIPLTAFSRLMFYNPKTRNKLRVPPKFEHYNAIELAVISKNGQIMPSGIPNIINGLENQMSYLQSQMDAL